MGLESPLVSLGDGTLPASFDGLKSQVRCSSASPRSSPTLVGDGLMAIFAREQNRPVNRMYSRPSMRLRDPGGPVIV